MRDSLGIYISVPFCRAKCTYCNFASGVFAAGASGPARMDAYVERVCAEMRGVRGWIGRMEETNPTLTSPFGSAQGTVIPSAGSGQALGHPGTVELPGVVDSIYFGGGTPSLLGAEQMQRLFAALRGEFLVGADVEVTLECAPGQLDEDTLEEMLRQGMNRVSFGVQSFVDAEAKAVGRLHTRAVVEAEIRRLRAAGVANINVDLIAGLPGQTMESWRESVDVALATGVPHVSVYMLEVDEDSRLGREVLSAGNREVQGTGNREVQGTGKRLRYGADDVPEDDAIADWYGVGCERLAASGVKQYEISNFAREGAASIGKDKYGDSDSASQDDAFREDGEDWRSRHNVKYWRRKPYVGFGLDAHSMLRSGVGGVRWANGDDLGQYLEAREKGPGSGDLGSPLVQLAGPGAGPAVEWIGQEKGFEEAMFLGMRMNEGVDLQALGAEFGDSLVRGAVEAMGDVEAAGLVARNERWVRLTARGRMASNEVFSRLLVGAVV